MKKLPANNKPVKPSAPEVAYGGKSKEEAMSNSASRAQAPSLGKLQKTFREVCSNLAAYTSGSKLVTWTKIGITFREDGTWLAVLTYDDIDTLERMVCFGNGETFEGALVGLSKSLAAGRVQKNKPYTPK